MSDLDNVDEELRVARALRDSMFAEREAIERLSPAQQERLFARVENILDLLERLEGLKLQRAAILQFRGAS
jgi:hypothetical protein